ncbi:MBL fold metallo-hydrolase [Ornithinimicrobium ciconiae]|nr:MBL fold metallo-hydrolase [Ornithinimicrobium ciconiae]
MTYRDFPMPARLSEPVQAWVDAGGRAGAGEPAPAKPSSTVMLLRPGAQGPEVFVLRRATTMAFAANMLAFPGGGVDPRDADPDVPWAGPSPQGWASRLRTSVERARELVIAAAREVFEECGVLLAGPDADSVVADLTAPVWDEVRDALLARELSFAELLIQRDLVLRTDLLGLRAHWITPEAEPKRYDTRFFVARLPEGQLADDRSSEAAVVLWESPLVLLAQHDAGEHLMLPPTRVMLEQLARADSLDVALDAAAEVWPVMPWPAERDGVLWMRAPIDAAGDGLPQSAPQTRTADTDTNTDCGHGHDLASVDGRDHGEELDMTPWSGGPLGERTTCRLCPNPGPMTLDGTNTWIVSEPGATEAVVIDPGPLDEDHLQRVLADVAARGARVALLLFTHEHFDHAESMERMRELTGAPARGNFPGAEPLADGELLQVGGVRLRVVLTPGHTMASVCFLLEEERTLFTGDTILGRGTTVVAHPDGQLGAYLHSLEKIAHLVDTDEVTTLAPGHGPVLTDAAGTVAQYAAHRQERLAQVRQAASGRADLPRPELADLVVSTVYADVPQDVWPAARQSVLAQLDHLGLGIETAV